MSNYTTKKILQLINNCGYLSHDNSIIYQSQPLITCDIPRKLPYMGIDYESTGITVQPHYRKSKDGFICFA